MCFWHTLRPENIACPNFVFGDLLACSLYLCGLIGSKLVILWFDRIEACGDLLMKSGANGYLFYLFFYVRSIGDTDTNERSVMTGLELELQSRAERRGAICVYQSAVVTRRLR